MQPNGLSLQERKQELVRAELFNAAWQLFGERGYEATTVAQIAAAAGVSRRTFFRYYASKEDVLVETSDELAEAMLERHALMEERLAVQLAVRLNTDVARDSTPALLAFIARAMMDTAFNIAYDHDRGDVAALVAELFTKLGEHTALRARSVG